MVQEGLDRLGWNDDELRAQRKVLGEGRAGAPLSTVNGYKSGVDLPGGANGQLDLRFQPSE